MFALLLFALPTTLRFSTRRPPPRCPCMSVSTSISPGPSWTLDYPSPDAPPVHADLSAATEAMARMSSAGTALHPHISNAPMLSPDTLPSDLIGTLVDVYADYWHANTLLRNVATYAMCVSSVDGSHADAKRLYATVQKTFARCRAAFEPAAAVLDACPENVFEEFLSRSKQGKSAEYMLRHSRKMAAFRLSVEEENMVTSLGVTGHSAWGSLYSDLGGVLKVRVGGKEMGLAMAEAMRDDGDESVRKESWEAIREAWMGHRETCAAMLNAITGWRLDLYEKRGYESYLTSSLHSNRMSADTLSALMRAIDESAEIGRRALRLQARVLGKDRLDVWDLFAPAPMRKEVMKKWTFEEGIELIANAVGEVDTEAGEFVRMMMDNKWIEAGRGPNKRPGAYCTGFAKTRTPRVYLSDYNGGAALLLTLAHELGHAFHSWQMRDLPLQQASYPMNLAETASIFFETVVGNALLQQADTSEERLGMLWGEAESAATFLLNIPARLRFEEGLNEKRKNGTLSSDEIDDLMVESWKRYYGDSIRGLERVGVFSQSKLHFYLTGISFYNWPYSFGYLFALGVYAKYHNAEDKTGFASMYRALLRDTGRMDAEEVVLTHLDGKADDPEFWHAAIKVAEGKVDQLERVVEEIERMK